MEPEQLHTIEKQQQLLQNNYLAALDLLYLHKLQEGLKILYSILQNPLIQSLPVLRYSTLLSTAELEEKLGSNLQQSIKYMYQALLIKQDHTLYKRLGDLCAKAGYLFQAEYCIKMALKLCPILLKNYLMESLIQIKILEQEYLNALQIIQELLEIKFTTERQKPKKLYCLIKLGRQKEIQILSKTVSIEYLPKYDEQRQKLSLRSLKMTKKITVLQQEKHPKVQQVIKIHIQGKSSWHSLVGQVYLMLKYLVIIKEQRKKALKPKYKGMEQYFSSKNWISYPVSIVNQISQEQDKSFSFCEIFMNFKRRKNKDSSTKMSSDDQQKKYITTKLQGNIKEWINNTALHIDSLVFLQAKNKQKNISQITNMKSLNEILWPDEDFYSQYIGNIGTTSETIEVMDPQKFPIKGTESRPIEIQDEPKIQKNTDTRFDDDFALFYSKKSYFITIFQLVRDIIVHFFADRQNTEIYCPHPLMTSQQSIITSLLTKLYILCNKFCLNLFPENELLTPILQLLVQRHGDLLRKISKNKEKILFLKQQRQFIRKLIVDIQCRIFSSSFAKYLKSLNEKAQIQNKIRLYHSLAIFYSYSDQEIQSMAIENVQLFEKQMNQLKRKFNIAQVDRFWLQSGPTKHNLKEYVENRIKQNFLKKEIDQKGSSLSDALSASIQNFRKHKQKQVGEALQLYYKNIFELIQDSVVYPIFLKHVSEILEIYLQIIEKKPYKQDYSKYLHKIGELMKIQELSTLLIKRTNQQQKKQNQNLIQPFVKLSIILTKINVQRLFLLQPEQQGYNNSFKGFLCCLNQILRFLVLKKDKINVLTNVVIFVHNMAHFSSDNSNAHKKVNLHFTPKYIQYLLQDPRINQEEESFQSPMKSSQKKDEPTTFKHEVEDMLNCYYGHGKKITEFNIQTKKDVQNYVGYLKNFYSEYFNDPSIKIKPQINNVLRESRKIQKEMAKSNSFCESFQKLRQKLMDWYNYDKKQQGFLENIKSYIEQGRPSLCSNLEQHNCFQNFGNLHHLYLDINYIVARSLQNQDVTDNEEFRQDIQRAIKKAERIYTEILCLNLKKPEYWYCLSKINKKKAYIGFDEIIYGEASIEWKYGFIASKRLAAFMKANLKMGAALSQQLQEDILILNLLKIYQRKMLYTESKVYSQADQQNKKNKLIDAYQTVISRMQCAQNIKSSRIKFLFMIYCKFPYIRYTSFCSSECITIINSIKQINDYSISDQSQEYIKLNTDQLWMDILFLIFEILNKYHKNISVLENRSEPQINMIHAGFKDLDLFMEYLVKQFPNLAKKREEETQNLFQLGTTKRLLQQPNLETIKNSLKWLERFSSKSLSSQQVQQIKLAFSVIILNLKTQIQQSLKSIQSKKGKFHRYFVNCCYYISKISGIYENNPRQALKSLSDIISLKSDDIVLVYRIYENKSLEKDNKLAEFFNRNLFYFINKNRIVKWVIKLLWQNQQNDKLFQLYRKFMKSMPKEESGSHNRVCGLLSQITLKGIVSYLNKMFQNGNITEEVQKWMIQIYDKNIRKKSLGKDNPVLVQLVINYYRKNEKYQDLASNQMQFQKGKSILDEKQKARKTQKQKQSKIVPQ